LRDLIQKREEFMSLRRVKFLPCFSTLYNLNPGTESDIQRLEFEDL
jgi:hypothetical protein